MLLLLFSQGGPPPVLDPLPGHILTVAQEDRRIVVGREARALTVAQEDRQMRVRRA